jgi:hypothetical protein
MKRMLDLFCGRLGWTLEFLARGWQVVGLDLVAPPSIPEGFFFQKRDVMFTKSWVQMYGPFDFICASSVCDGFASFGMKHFRPNPPYPALEIELFNHTRALCEESGLPYLMENVRAAQQFVGPAINHCGPFYLWGNAVPPILPQGITKAKWKSNVLHGRNAPGNFAPELNLPKSQRKARLATIPPELASCVADYAERLLEQKAFGDSLPEQADGRHLNRSLS